MNAFQTTLEQGKKSSSIDEGKPGFRTKTISMRLTPDELAELESAAGRAGKPPSEWLRETALSAARERPSEPMELLLAEVWAVRHSLLSLFYAGAQATVEGRRCSPNPSSKSVTEPIQRSSNRLARCSPNFWVSRPKRVWKGDE